jgi:hypothetical protein
LLPRFAMAWRICGCTPSIACRWRCLRGAYVGNHLNGGTNRGGAYGFRLESLMKADSIKGADNKTTLVDVVVTVTLTAAGDARLMRNLSTVGS